ncbi:MAG: Uncharacterized protein G01um101416_984 [Microgenomates group bacterium Gr01-1014_16]|nr:MAG: Uncharacterized protein G01um101416_984 [Microgenomates group bacterium Gr01-1014_16]
MWERIEKWIEGRQWLIVILAAVIVLRVPSLFEPYWYGDEGIYLTVGQALDRGEALYKDIHDNKPPLLYWMAAAAGGNQFWFKLLAGLWCLGTVGIGYWTFGKIWGKDEKGKLVSTAVLAILTTLPAWEGNIANAELFFLLPTVAAMGILWGTKDWKRVFLGGIVIGIGGLFKMPAIVEAGIWPAMWWLGKDKKWLAKSLVLAAGVILPIATSVSYFATAGASKEYWTAAWAQNLPYLSSWKATSDGAGIYSIKGRVVLVIGILGLVAWRGKKWNKRAQLAVMWGIVTLFAATLSGRPYPHYLLQTAGAVALAAGLLARGERKAGVGIWAGVLAVMIVFKFWWYPVGAYYLNFGKWMWGQVSQEEYFRWFNGAVVRNYEVARIVMEGSGPDDRLFVWGDEPMIYALTRRRPVGKYTAAYHIRDFGALAETVRGLESSSPRYIVVIYNENELPGLGQLLDERYKLEKTVDGVRVYRRVISISWL